MMIFFYKTHDIKYLAPICLLTSCSVQERRVLLPESRHVGGRAEVDELHSKVEGKKSRAKELLIVVEGVRHIRVEVVLRERGDVDKKLFALRGGHALPLLSPKCLSKTECHLPQGYT